MQSDLVFKAKCQAQDGTFEIRLAVGSSATQLLAAVCDKVGAPSADLIKVLSGGKIVGPNSDVTKLAKMLLVMRTAPAPDEEKKRAEADALQMEQEKLAMIRDAALEFASRNDDGDGQYFAEIQDQNGKRVALPENDRRNLIASQVLHERGKKMMQDGKFEEAMQVLTNAEKMLMQVSPALVAIIDNYGLLMLDISWCYMRLGRLETLRDATQKLRAAREGLERAYGPNMERLLQVKGGVAPEKIMYVRLYLLQGVVSFHRGEIVSARSYLNQCEDLLRQLRVTEEDIQSLIEMGFTASESRRAMRVSGKNHEEAVIAIMARREQLRQQRDEERKRRLQERIGRTVAGELVSLELLEELKAMGFDAKLSGLALRQTNNDLAGSVDVLTNNPELLTAKSQLDLSNSNNGEQQDVAPEALAHLLSMGFSDFQSTAALRHTKGNVEVAAELLASGWAAPEPMDMGGDGANENGEGDEFDDNGDNNADDMQQETPEQLRQREEEARRRAVKHEATMDLVDAIARDRDHDIEDEFDLALDEEANVLNTYKEMMGLV